MKSNIYWLARKINIYQMDGNALYNIAYFIIIFDEINLSNANQTIVSQTQLIFGKLTKPIFHPSQISFYILREYLTPQEIN